MFQVKHASLLEFHIHEKRYSNCRRQSFFSAFDREHACNQRETRAPIALSSKQNKVTIKSIPRWANPRGHKGGDQWPQPFPQRGGAPPPTWEQKREKSQSRTGGGQVNPASPTPAQIWGGLKRPPFTHPSFHHIFIQLMVSNARGGSTR